MEEKQDETKKRFLVSKEMSDAELLLFIQNVEETALYQAPENMKEQIMIEMNRIDIQFAVRKSAVSKNIQFWIYSLKISAAMICAISFLLLGNLDSFLNVQKEKKEEKISITSLLHEKSNGWSEDLQNFSNGIYNE